MSLSEFEQIADQCEGRTFQFALGGRGDPDQHESFAEILNACRARGIVPNFTSSGCALDGETARLSARYCGAVAISWQRSDYTLRAIDTLLQAGVTTNIHYVLSNDTIDEALRLLLDDAFPQGINRVIFLLHKPVGAGERRNVLRVRDPRVIEFFGLFNLERFCSMSGFDSCSVPALLNFAPTVHPATIETCEGARFSAYVSPDLELLPCSFDQGGRWAADLKHQSLQQAWNSELFEEFRSIMKSSCPDCRKRTLCLGGCPIDSDIVLCNKCREVRTPEDQN